MDTYTLPSYDKFSLLLADQIILITGASDGIGRALAIRAAKAGATCILLGKSVKKLEAVYDEIVAAGYPEPAIHPLNLLHAQPQHANELAQSIDNLFGRLDALVHNAAILGQISPLEHLAPHQWQQVIQINLNAPYLLTHACLPILKKSVAGSILFTTAEEGYQAKAYWSAYSASKFGLTALAQSLHQELENNTSLRVNCINPGKVRTGMRLHAYPGIEPATLPAAEEIVDNYIYLLSPQAKDIRGKRIEISRG